MLRRFLLMSTLSVSAACGQSWVLSTPVGGVAPCTAVETERQLQSELKYVGWQKGSQPAPPIDFSKVDAVVIAPGSFLPGYHLKFVDIKWDGHHFRLTYTHALVTLVAHLNVTTGPEALVVQIQHYQHLDDRLICDDTGVPNWSGGHSSVHVQVWWHPPSIPGVTGGRGPDYGPN
jgi:hypothetical protein